MNNLLFYALIAVLLWYFFYYLPNQKKTRPVPKPTPTEPSSTELPISSEASLTPQDQSALEQTLDTLIKSMNELSEYLDK